MRHIGIFAAASALLFAAASAGTGCSSSSGTGTTSGTGTGGTTSTSTGTGTGGTSNPAPPTIGTQLDRFGRPVVNIVLNHGFDGNAMAAGMAKDAYNKDSDPTQWAANYTPEIEKNLAILDAFDGKCDNQIGYASPASATSYATLAGALSDDRLYLDTAGTTCTQYLAVEANTLGVAPNMDCGGRALDYTVMDTTYSVLTMGKLTGVSNGVAMNNVASSTTFPYEANPN